MAKRIKLALRLRGEEQEAFETVISVLQEVQDLDEETDLLNLIENEENTLLSKELRAYIANRDSIDFVQDIIDILNSITY